MTEPTYPPVIAILGPTASGKSALALDLATRLDGVIINADSMQVYRDLRILTARPDDDDLARAPHRLYGFQAADTPCSAADWRTRALVEIAAAGAAGQVPILCGGSGLYFKALTEGLAPIPDISPALRARLRARLADIGGAAFRRELATRDPAGAARLHDGDSQRLIRAMEVVEGTGRTLAAWHRQASPPAPLSCLTFVLAPPRPALYAHCDARFETMVAAGAVAEARRLKALGLCRDLPAMKAVGVRQLIDYIDEKCNLNDAIAGAQQETRRYAKRQTTWFKHQIEQFHPLPQQYSEKLVDEIFPKIREFLLTTDA